MGLFSLVLVLGFLALPAIRLISGQGLGLWPYVSLALAVVDSRSVSNYSHGDYTNIIFLHHSTGKYLIAQGGVRERFAEAGYDFWDHGYSWHTEGLTAPDGSLTGYSYNIPNDNTDPDGLAEIFSQQVYQLPLNAFSGLLQHEVIAFKSCFPVSHITSDGQLAKYKSYYLLIRQVMDQHPDKIFIIVTPPPLNPAETNSAAATRARAFATWLKSKEFLDGHTNVFTFDFFDYLAEADPTSPDHNMLRREYRQGQDSHPNQIANQATGPLFVDFIIDSIQSYRSRLQP
jgi:hypothetical protein